MIHVHILWIILYNYRVSIFYKHILFFSKILHNFSGSPANPPGHPTKKDNPSSSQKCSEHKPHRKKKAKPKPKPPSPRKRSRHKRPRKHKEDHSDSDEDWIPMMESTRRSSKRSIDCDIKMIGLVFEA